MSKKFFVVLLLAMLLIGGSGGMSDMGAIKVSPLSTWTINPNAWDNKPLPSLGLQISKSPRSLSYSMDDTNLPTSLDWRSTPNGTRVTPVKDQDGCGACVAYAVIGQIESAMEIAANSNKPTPDLAEMEFFKGTCAGGWNFDGPHGAYQVAKSSGIMSQHCYDTGTCTNRTKIISWSTTSSPKQALQYGPIVTGVDWDQNWFFYDGGVISDYSGQVAGGHALCVVGYNDPGKYWVVKNSWGTAWGESGYFRIDYSVAAEAGMGTSYPWFTVLVNASPGPNPPTPPANNNKTFTAKTLTNPTGAYVFSEIAPDKKPILTTKAFQPSMPFGIYPTNQDFIFSLQTPTGTYLSTDKLHASTMKTSFGYWVIWRSVAGVPYKTDAYIEVDKK